MRATSLVYIFFFSFCGEILACDCGRAFDDADIIFIGKLTSQSKWRLMDEHQIAGWMSRVIIKNTFEVFQVHKGPDLTKIIVELSDGGSDCDALPLDVGKIYKIYAADHTDFGFQWVLDVCGSAKEIPVHEKQ